MSDDDTGIRGINAYHLLMPRSPHVTTDSWQHQVFYLGEDVVACKLQTVRMACVGMHFAVVAAQKCYQ